MTQRDIAPVFSRRFNTIFALGLIAVLSFSASAYALTGDMTAQSAATPVAEALPQTPVETPLEPLTVTDVIIDKTAKNAVVARDEAITDAQRSAFQKLAERNMTPEDFKNFKLPSDKAIAAVVQDFEIKKEQLSSTRYVANFTVRFRDGVRNYINVARPVTAAASPYDESEASGEVLPVTGEAPVGKNVLVLPYFENMAGDSLLWEDPNPWRQAWQSADPKSLERKDHSFAVPLGDINDVATGSSDAVWSGDYTGVQKLQGIYSADDVLLAVANKSGSVMSIDLYVFHDRNLMRLKTLTPYIGDKSDAEAFAQGVTEVLDAATRPQEMHRENTVSNISRSLIARQAETPPMAQVNNADTENDAAAAAMAQTPVATMLPAAQSASNIQAAMSFDSYATWMEMQKRLSTVVPAVQLSIQSLSSTGAQFTMAFPGSTDVLAKVLAEHGIILGVPAVVVDSGTTQPAVYDVQLVNKTGTN